MNQIEKIGILGVGNLLLADEGFGVHVIERLQQKYRFPPTVELLDGGTAGIMLAPFMEDKDILFVLDVVNLDDKPGSIHQFSNEDVCSGNIQTRMSPHQVGLLEILDLCRLRGQAPDRVEMITVVPADLSTKIGLSSPLEVAVDEVIAVLLEKLEKISVFPEPLAARTE
jgi:hydrogenase maturation protease